MAVSVWGRLYLWLGVLAGSLLLVAIIAMVVSIVSRNREATSPAAGQNLEGFVVHEMAGTSMAFGNTYHPAEVWVARVSRNPHYVQDLEFHGRLVPRRDSQIGFQLGGQLEALHVDLGQTVEEGQEIARLDTQLLVSRARQLAAQVQRAEAVLEELRAGPRQTTIDAAQAEIEALRAEAQHLSGQRRRLAELLQQQAVSQQEFDAAFAAEQAILKRQMAAEQRWVELSEGTRPEQVEAQEALVRSLESESQSLEIQIALSSLRAPFAGFIAEQYAEIGQVLVAGQPLLHLLQTQPLEAHIGVSPEVAAGLTAGCQGTIQAGSQRLTACLRRVVPRLDPNTQTVTAIYELPPLDEVQLTTWFPGRAVRLEWQQRVSVAGFWLPNDALSRGRRGLWNVFQFLPEGDGAIPPAAADLWQSPEDESGRAEPAAGSAERPAPDSEADRVPARAISPAVVDGDSPGGSESRPVPGSVRLQQVEMLYTAHDWSYVRGTLPTEGWIVVQGGQRLLEGQRARALTVPTNFYSRLPQTDPPDPPGSGPDPPRLDRSTAMEVGGEVGG